MVEVVLMCGPAGSGKSTHAHQLESRGYVVLSFDAIAWELGYREHPLTDASREEVQALLQARLTARVNSGESVVVDSSFWSRAARDQYRELLVGMGIEPVIHYVTAPRDVILDRLARRDNSGPDEIAVPERQAHAYIDHFEVPADDEGPIVRVTGT